MRERDVWTDAALRRLTPLAGDPEGEDEDAGEGDFDEDELDEENDDDWEDAGDEEEGWWVAPGHEPAVRRRQPLPIDFARQSS